MIPNRPTLKKDYNGIMMAKGTMQLRNEENIMLLKGNSVSDVVERLLPLMDGKNTIEQISKKLDDIPEETIIKVIEMLQEHFVVEDGDDVNKSNLPQEVIKNYSSQIDYFTLFSERLLHDGTRVNKFKLFETLYEKTCLVIGDGKVAKATISELATNGIGNIMICVEDENNQLVIEELSNSFPYVNFKKQNIDYISSGSKLDMVILADDIITDNKSRKINEMCIINNIPWITINIGEIRFEVGPLVVPHETACYSCYMNRLNGNRAHFEEEMTYSNYKNLESDNIKVFMSDTMVRVAAGIMTWEVVKYLSKIFSCVTTGRVIHFNILNLEMKTHTILKMPKCKVCSKIETVPFTEPYAVYLP